MKGAWRMARVAGVDFYVHWTFWLLVPWGVWQGLSRHGDAGAAGFILLALLLLFGCVALHELGHALMALRLDIVVRRVVLLPIGGLAQIQAVSHRPLHEFLIAAAGPLVNLGLATGLALLLGLLDPVLLGRLWAGPAATLESLFIRVPFWESPLRGFLTFLIGTNLVLFFFNLIPTLPMDGGRMLRALLALALPYNRATQLAIGLGQLAALVLFWLAFHLHSLGLFFIALCVCLAGLPMLLGSRQLPTREES